MPHVEDPRRRSSAPRMGGVALLVLLLLGVGMWAPGQGLQHAPKHYFNELTFQVPFEMGMSKGVKQVLLHVSMDDGKTFKHHATVAASGQRAFIFKATREGWHYFAVQIEDYNGKRVPARIDSSVVGLMVCVDTKAPEVTLNPILPKNGATIAVEWKVTDNVEVDPRRLVLDYRRGGKGSWTALNMIPKTWARYDWSPHEAGEYEVRLTAYDMAGNKTAKSIKVRAGTPAAKSGHADIPAGEARVLYVPKRTFKLDYKIDNVGPSKVKNVEVWLTRDTRAWSKFSDDAPPEPVDGYEIKVPSTGRYGFTLRPISGVGRAIRPPNINEQPQIWVEVDEMTPVVTLEGVTVGEGVDNKTITVNWTATDRFLADAPITISYSENRDGPWTEMKSKQANTGSCKVSTAAITPYQFYVKVEAVDRAGNRGSAQTKDTVKVDTSEPRVKDLTVIRVKP